MSEDDRQRVLLATERMGEFLDMMERWSQLTWREVERIVTVGVSSSSDKRRMLATIQKLEGQGVAAPCLVHNFREELLNSISSTFQHVDKFGLSALGAMLFKPSRAMEWGDYREAVLVDNFDEGQFGYINGNPRVGKTSLAVEMIRIWLEDERHEAFGNIAIMSPPGRYHYVKNCKTLLLAIANMPEGSVGLFFLDEGAVSGFAKQDAATRRAKDVTRLLRVIGKLHFSLVYVEQVASAVPTIIQTFSTNRYFVHAHGVISIDLTGPKKWFSTKVRAFPKARLEFDSRDLTMFNTNDVALDGLFAALGGVVDQKGAIKAFLEASSP